jgi:hypothetical protein
MTLLESLHPDSPLRKHSYKVYFRALRGFLRRLKSRLFLTREVQRSPFSVKIPLYRRVAGTL